MVWAGIRYTKQSIICLLWLCFFFHKPLYENQPTIGKRTSMVLFPIKTLTSGECPFLRQTSNLSSNARESSPSFLRKWWIIYKWISSWKISTNQLEWFTGLWRTSKNLECRLVQSYYHSMLCDFLPSTKYFNQLYGMIDNGQWKWPAANTQGVHSRKLGWLAAIGFNLFWFPTPSIPLNINYHWWGIL